MDVYKPGEVYYKWNHELNRMGGVFKVVRAGGSGRRGVEVTFLVDGNEITLKGGELAVLRRL